MVPSGSVWVAEPDSLSCLFPSVNLWKIYKAVEKLGAYELVSKGSLVSCCAPASAIPLGELGSRVVRRAFWPADLMKIRIPRSSPYAVGGGTGYFASLTAFFPPASVPPSPYSKTRFAWQHPARVWRRNPKVQLSLPPCKGYLKLKGYPWPEGIHWPISSGVLQVTGRRLWKNVYDELGGSPGSTSAATCTRRHYERYGVPRGCCTPTRAFLFRGLGRCVLGVRCKTVAYRQLCYLCVGGGGQSICATSRVLVRAGICRAHPCVCGVCAVVHWQEGADSFGDSRSSGGEEPEGLKGSPAEASCEDQLLGFCWTHWLFPRLVLPYVRHLKGEDDKPLPPTKPRKQYKMTKELRGDDGTTEKSKKAKDSERQVDQVSTKLSEVAFTAPMLLWPWLLFPAWNARNLLPGQELAELGVL